ncbi:hypothetical protein [Myxococcus landrumensis]|uniref:Uncharacterized protein n=1 Tax=Myxococcus landrumensis TaxID=2813577 RepID=A0ABX7N6Y0_9BACT|nr:hypothetical protein [Myxococcus landrumus]QSQ14532.1 hypothetical protein JY572_00070 [Myxococcus landrumus]
MTGPAASFVSLAAAFLAGALQLLRNLDKGNGVYLSMSWFVPGVAPGALARFLARVP